MTSAQTANADPAPGPFYVDAGAAEAFGCRLLVAHGLPEEDAATVARCLVLADLRGVDTHGLQTLPHYLERVRRGLINPRPNLKVERVTPMVGALDGQDAFGFVVATKAMAEAIDMAGKFGVGIVSARRSTHFCMAANYSLQAMDAGGKDGVIRHVFSAMNPQGTWVFGFKQPSKVEAARDFLWRAHARAPGKGAVVIFNRSHYEDVLVVRVHKLVTKPVWSKRVRADQ